MEISNSISIATQNLGEADLPILKLYFSLLNLALKNVGKSRGIRSLFDYSE